jgi:hypothetical protein
MPIAPCPSSRPGRRHASGPGGRRSARLPRRVAWPWSDCMKLAPRVCAAAGVAAMIAGGANVAAAQPASGELVRIPVTVSFDVYRSVEMGADITMAAAAAFGDLGGKAVSPLAPHRRTGFAVRLAKTIFLDHPVAVFLVIFQHEASGHGGRAREFGVRAGASADVRPSLVLVHRAAGQRAGWSPLGHWSRHRVAHRVARTENGGRSRCVGSALTWHGRQRLCAADGHARPVARPSG